MTSPADSVVSELPRIDDEDDLSQEIFRSLQPAEKIIVRSLMDTLVSGARAAGLDLWAMNPRANATREKLSQWVIDRRRTPAPAVRSKS